MGRKKRGVEVLSPFCHYCDKEFLNANILLQHQKNRHFACRLCNRKYSTAASLATHMSQVHDRVLEKVPNAMAKRDQVDLHIYGMEGVPAEVIEDRLRRKVKKKMIYLEKELKKLYKIDIDDPAFRLVDYDIPEARPKKVVPDVFRQSMQLMPMKFMPQTLMFPPPIGGSMPPMHPGFMPPMHLGGAPPGFIGGPLGI